MKYITFLTTIYTRILYYGVVYIKVRTQNILI